MGFPILVRRHLNIESGPWCRKITIFRECKVNIITVADLAPFTARSITDNQGWGQLHNINSTPTPEVSTPTPTPASLMNINSNSNSGSFNSNSNSGKSLEYQLQLQLRRFQLQFQLQLRSWSWSWTQLQLQLRSWPQPCWQCRISRFLVFHEGGFQPPVASQC